MKGFTVSLEAENPCIMNRILNNKWESTGNESLKDVDYEIGSGRIKVGRFEFLNEMADCPVEELLQFHNPWQTHDGSIVTYERVPGTDGMQKYDAWIETADLSLDPGGETPPLFKFRFAFGTPTLQDADAAAHQRLNLILWVNIKHPCRGTALED